MSARNELCSCGSGKKYKRCCLLKAQQALDNEKYFTQAVTLHQSGRLDEAEQIYRGILQRDPHEPDALHYLGLLNFQRGNFAHSVALIQQAITLKSGVPAYHCNLANSQKRLGQYSEAEAAYRAALRLDAGFVLGLFNYGVFLLEQGRVDDAAAQFSLAVQRAPTHAHIHMQLGHARFAQERIDEAARCFRQALALKPDMFEAHLALASMLLRFGKWAEAQPHFLQAIVLRPESKNAYQGYLLALNYAQMDAQQVLLAHQRWQSHYLSAIKPLPAPQLERNERIKVGYVSADFRLHALRFFMRPILQHHDETRFEVFCYSLVAQEDAATAEFKKQAEHWMDCAHLDDVALAQRIRADGIDVLVDLAGHTADNRLAMFAMQPAPVQLSMLGYMNTTGMSAMQYRIADRVACPDSMQPYFTEKILPMPHSQWCYQPDEDAPECVELPSLQRDFFAFGAFHNVAKVGDTVLQAWCDILLRVPQAKLFMVLWGEEAKQRVTQFFAARQIDAQRLVLLPPKPYAEYLAYYQQVDLTLDTFPYSGGTVSCESLWMGVPYVSYTAATPAGRGGASILRAVGLSELAAESVEGYVDLAVTLAGDATRLQGLRANLRHRVAASPLMDGEAYTRALEAHYTAISARV